MSPEFVITALSVHLPEVMRWAGALARRMRQYNIGLGGKTSGSALTDALTLADLTVQELLVSALRDTDPIFRHCRIEAEESTGDLARFPAEAELTISLDPIDGTKQYRDKTGNGYAVMLHLRNLDTVLYSLVFVPEKGEYGWWVECDGERLVCGPDDPARPAGDVLRSLPKMDRDQLSAAKKIYLIGFQQRDAAAAQQVTEAGLIGVAPDDMPGSIYELMAHGEFAGSLIHSPNVYDFPVSLQIARLLGGDAVWVHNRQPVNFRETWLDDRADMLRLPGIVATSPNRQVLEQLCQVAQDWNPARYHDEAGL
ncbi:MAG: inositol monophosphatase family protein [Planctomycetaceae bacterium]